MKEKYGNSFGSSSESMKLATYTPWIRVDEFYPGGAMVKVGDYKETQSQTIKVGDRIPLGTPIYMAGLGSKAYFTLDTNVIGQEVLPTLAGLTYEDAYVGEEGCSLTIVTRGTLKNADLENPFSSRNSEEVNVLKELRTIGITIV